MPLIVFEPGQKGEWYRIGQAILAGEITVTDVDLPALVEMLQDTNWPGSKEISEYLNQHRRRAMPALKNGLREAFQKNDDIWNYWIMRYVFEDAQADEIKMIEDELRKTAQRLDIEGACIVAVTLLLKGEMISTQEARTMAQVFYDAPPTGSDFRFELEDFEELIQEVEAGGS